MEIYTSFWIQNLIKSFKATLNKAVEKKDSICFPSYSS